eukprot:scaffold13377_cov101-Isochrysis_galbana.AAC.2
MSPPCSRHSRFTGKPARLTNKRRRLWVNLYGPGQQPGPLTPRSRAAGPAASSKGRSLCSRLIVWNPENSTEEQCYKKLSMRRVSDERDVRGCGFF